MKIFYPIASLLVCVFYLTKGFQGFAGCDEDYFFYILLILKVRIFLLPFLSVTSHVPFCLLAFREANSETFLRASSERPNWLL